MTNPVNSRPSNLFSLSNAHSTQQPNRISAAIRGVVGKITGAVSAVFRAIANGAMKVCGALRDAILWGPRKVGQLFSSNAKKPAEEVVKTQTPILATPDNISLEDSDFALDDIISEEKAENHQPLFSGYNKAAGAAAAALLLGLVAAHRYGYTPNLATVQGGLTSALNALTGLFAGGGAGAGAGAGAAGAGEGTQ
jgi:hypothetical protein